MFNCSLLPTSKAFSKLNASQLYTFDILSGMCSWQGTIVASCSFTAFLTISESTTVHIAAHRTSDMFLTCLSVVPGALKRTRTATTKIGMLDARVIIQPSDSAQDGYGLSPYSTGL